MQTLLQETEKLLDILGSNEEPLGLFYSDDKPDGPGPKESPRLSHEAEQKGELDLKAVWANFSCVMGRVLLARKKKVATWLAADAYGCAGASFYAGFHKPQLEMVIHYISTGIPGMMEGELFMPSVDASRDFFNRIDPVPAPKKYCVIKPLSLFVDGEEPEVVAFFARGELLVALSSLVSFTTGTAESVVMPFGAGCANLISWPLHYQAQGREMAVLGGNDPACRALFNVDECSFAVPIALYRKMLEAVPKSFLRTEHWDKCRKRIIQSRERWTEQK